MEEQVAQLDRGEAIERALADYSAIIVVPDLNTACDVANTFASEHVQIITANDDAVLAKIAHAGAIFVGHYAAESMGDYSAGPSHVLPTAGTARFSSPLGVYDFQKRSSIIKCSQKGAARLGETASVLAREEGLIAHALSAECRINGRLPASKT